MSAPEQRDRMSLVVESVRVVAHEVVHVVLRHPDGELLPEWSPGAHIDIELPSGLRRQYSLCGEPDDLSAYEIAVLREPDGRGGSAELHELVAAGVRLDVGSPRNNFEFHPAEHYLFVAGGIGVTPLMAMAEAAERAGADWRLIYGARERSRLSFVERLERYPADRVEFWPEDEFGRPDLVAEFAKSDPVARIYACGPSGMLDAVTSAHAADPAERALHIERFTAEGPVDVTGDEIEVVLSRSGQTLVVPGDRSILSAVREILPRIPYSCEEGYCGECETGVVQGEPDHRDVYLTDDERESGETMMLCVSRCSGRRLVLDL